MDEETVCSEYDRLVERLYHDHVDDEFFTDF